MGNSIHKLIMGDPDLHTSLDKTGHKYRDALRKKTKEEMTGWERVKVLFTTDEYGEVSPELQRCKDTVMITFLAGAIMGGIGRSRIAYTNFFRSNAHVSYETPLQARSKLQEILILGFGSGAFRIGWRVGAFSTIYTVSSASLTAYRGKASILDPIAGGSVAGFLYKFHEGPRLTLAGAVIGGVFGLIGGSITTLALAMTGLTPDQVLAYDYQKIADRRKQVVDDMKSTRPENSAHTLTLTDFHASILETTETPSQSSDPAGPKPEHVMLPDIPETEAIVLAVVSNAEV